MIGVGKWLESIIQANLVANEGNWKALILHLHAANEAFATVRLGQDLASKDKWENWYRGEKKMNLNNMQAQTERITKLVKEHSQARSVN